MRTTDCIKRAADIRELIALKMDANNDELKTLNTAVRLLVAMLERLAKKNNIAIQESEYLAKITKPTCL